MKQMVLDIGLATDPTFQNFEVGENRLLLQHLQTWLHGTSEIVPTYVYGESGTGKSHLLRAAAHELQHQGGCVGWLDSNRFDAQEFHSAWSAVLLDDVQLYNPAQQHTAFNWLINAQTFGCRVLAAGNVAPIALPLREDLRTRLGWGNVFSLLPLSESAQRQVLRRSATDRGLVLGEEVLDYMLKHWSRDLGSLMEWLHQMDRYAMQTRRPVTIPLIKSMLENE
jgi:DnaA-homolog protein